MEFTTLLHQRWRPLVIIVAVLVLALVLEAGFYLGQHMAYNGMTVKPKAYREMQAELIAAQSALRSRDADLAIQATRQEVDRRALELVRQELASQREEIAGLVEALGFYRSLMSSGGVTQGLSLRGIELTAGQQPRHYEYRIIVQQEARKHAQLEGTLTAAVTGMTRGEPAEYSITDLSSDFKGEAFALDFKYFQSIEGSLVLPEGFDPTGVVVHAKTAAPHAYEVREDYPWQLEERFTHVGK